MRATRIALIFYNKRLLKLLLSLSLFSFLSSFDRLLLTQCESIFQKGKEQLSIS